MATFTVAELLDPPSYDDVKETVFTRLEAAGFTAIRSYAPESLPVGLVETESQALDEANQTAAFITASGYNSLAEDDGLDQLSHEVYDDQRFTGEKAKGFVTLTDVGNLGPFTFTVTSTAFSAGLGGLQYVGVAPDGVTQRVLPRGGTVNVYVEAVEVGSEYNVGVEEIDTFTQGVLPRVTVYNPLGWQQDQYGVSGTDPETDPLLRIRNSTKWGTLSQFKPSTTVQSGYENAARNADPQVTRVQVLTNLDLQDPGRCDVIIAGAAGALSPTVVATVQDAISVAQVGGPNIPETAKCVVTSATNLAVTVAGTVIVDAAYNNAAFLAQINGDLTTFFSSFLIGGGKLGKVSYERILGLISYRAGTSNSVVLDATDVTVNGATEDLSLQYYEVPVLTSTLTLQSI